MDDGSGRTSPTINPAGKAGAVRSCGIAWAGDRRFIAMGIAQCLIETEAAWVGGIGRNRIIWCAPPIDAAGRRASLAQRGRRCGADRCRVPEPRSVRGRRSARLSEEPVSTATTTPPRIPPLATTAASPRDGPRPITYANTSSGAHTRNRKVHARMDSSPSPVGCGLHTNAPDGSATRDDAASEASYETAPATRMAATIQEIDATRVIPPPPTGRSLQGWPCAKIPQVALDTDQPAIPTQNSSRERRT